MKRTTHFAVAVVTVAIVGACTKDDTMVKTASGTDTTISASADSASARGHSMVRFVNVGNTGKDVALQVGDQTLFESVKLSSVTDYREVDANLAKFSARAAGAADTTALAQNDEVLADGNRYTVFLMAEDLSRNTVRVIQDEVIPDSGMARIRIVHAAPGGPELDVSVANAKDKLFSGVNFKSEAGYKDVMPTKVVLEVRAKDEAKVLLRLPAMELRRGTATTIVISGTSKLGFFAFTDVMMPPMAPKM